MGDKIYKNITGREINVHTKKLPIDGIFKTDNIDQEIKNLLNCNYLAEIDPTKQAKTPSKNGALK